MADARAARWLTAAAATVHAAAAVLFLPLGAHVLAALSAASVIFLLWLRSRVRPGHIRESLFGGMIEAIAHTAIWAAAFGGSSRVHNFFVVYAVLGILAWRTEHVRARATLLATSSALWIVFEFAPAPGDGRWLGFLAPNLDSGAWEALPRINNLLVFATLGAIVDYLSRISEEVGRQLATAHARTAALLHDLLPRAVAERLLNHPGPLAERHTEATVIFADLVGFTPLAATQTPEQTVAMLEALFDRFDALAAQHGVEKIKTIGDAWMGAAGLPDPCADHAGRALALASAMLEAVDALREPMGHPLALRVGVHTGPVVAGVLGRHRRFYDVWGETVNLASRLESSGLPGRVQTTRATLDAIGPFTPSLGQYSPRGRISIKGIGEMETWISNPPTPGTPPVAQVTT